MQLNGNQYTLDHAVTCEGVGLHSGAPVRMTLHPAEEGSGVIFYRNDVPHGTGLIPALYDHVTETTLGTTITNSHGVSVATIEHLMAALWGLGVDNVTVELDGPEVPIMDGSSEPFVFLIECAGLVEQDAPREVIEVLRPITISVGDSTMTIAPAEGYVLDVAIEFSHDAIARQHARYDFEQVTFKQMLSRARTFGFAHEVEHLQKMGLARGGSLENAIVIGEKGVMNQGGLRFSDEFVRHKALDCVGDLYLAGAPIRGIVTASRPGHGVNNKLLRALFANPAAWRMTSDAPMSYAESALPLAAASASSFQK